jgi:hypothetical protein
MRKTPQRCWLTTTRAVPALQPSRLFRLPVPGSSDRLRTSAGRRSSTRAPARSPRVRRIQKGRVQLIGTRRRSRTHSVSPSAPACASGEEINSSLTRSPLLRCIIVNIRGRSSRERRDRTMPFSYLHWAPMTVAFDGGAAGHAAGHDLCDLHFKLPPNSFP